MAGQAGQAQKLGKKGHFAKVALFLIQENLGFLW